MRCGWGYNVDGCGNCCVTLLDVKLIVASMGCKIDRFV